MDVQRGTFKLLKKADSEDTKASLREILSLLRDTPISSDIPSPYTLMFKRKIKTYLPVVHFSTEGEESIVETKERHTASYATHQQEPPPIDPETNVWFQKTPNSRWQKAKVVGTELDRKYTIQTSDGAQYQRDRIHVRPSPEPTSKDPAPSELPTSQSNSSPQRKVWKGKPHCRPGVTHTSA
ncbi:hypothetical protein HOLleu_02879 [Holothuria leucospilota]|uniref:Uncharacterized protein n=1 Tax=Holothuria leucospilota TaxID=206669 RepID=A0A9Q1CRX1_HOLLE|nr:hypothetical protein HOLleu_02879 [Holothuria leucospilota]